jgi:hypothetical protein
LDIEQISVSFLPTYNWFLNGSARLVANALGAPARKRQGDSMMIAQQETGESN